MILFYYLKIKGTDTEPVVKFTDANGSYIWVHRQKTIKALLLYLSFLEKFCFKFCFSKKKNYIFTIRFINKLSQCNHLSS